MIGPLTDGGPDVACRFKNMQMSHSLSLIISTVSCRILKNGNVPCHSII